MPKQVRVLIRVMNFIVLSAFVDGCTDLGDMLIKKGEGGQLPYKVSPSFPHWCRN